jgi:hypothetical protein
VTGLQSYAGGNPLGLPAEYRLAFRELGLSIGLHAVEKLQGLIEQTPRALDGKRRLSSRVESLRQYVPLSRLIEKHWIDPANWRAGIWMEHRDINRVMLATSLVPDGYLLLR